MTCSEDARRATRLSRQKSALILHDWRLFHRRVVMWHGDRVIDSRGALEAVVRHAVELEDDYDDIAPTVTALAACGDTTVVPGLQEALDRFLDEGTSTVAT